MDCETKPEAETEDIPEVRRDVLKVEVGWQAPKLGLPANISQGSISMPT